MRGATLICLARVQWRDGRRHIAGARPSGSVRHLDDLCPLQPAWRPEEDSNDNKNNNTTTCTKTGTTAMNAADAAVAPQIVVSGFSSGGRTLADFQWTIIVEMAMGGGETGKAGFRPGVRPSLMTDRPPAVSKVTIFVDSPVII
ncbi:hypothetical protein niasHT_028776 [Heterodera trifolii]|uniref:Uncharacterized protein n=1 Tax=Heterodera trifolii TaxID=157864 RepID=A0ABD2KQ76_9BILA